MIATVSTAREKECIPLTIQKSKSSIKPINGNQLADKLESLNTENGEQFEVNKPKSPLSDSRSDASTINTQEDMAVSTKSSSANTTN